MDNCATILKENIRYRVNYIRHETNIVAYRLAKVAREVSPDFVDELLTLSCSCFS